MEEQRFGLRRRRRGLSVARTYGLVQCVFGAREGARAQIRVCRGELGQRARGRVAARRFG